MKKTLWKVAIIGCGSFTGGQYLPDIGKVCNAQLVATCDILPERAREYAQRAGIDQWYSSIDDLLEKCDFDILMNATSIPAHHEINMKALRAGKHVFTQKPAAATVEEVTQQMELAQQMGLKINMLRDDIRFAKKLIADGCIGEIMKVHTNVCHGGPEYFQYRDVNPIWFYEPGSGALYDMGVHGLHYVTDILGPARAVGCMAACSLPQRMIRTGKFDGEIIRTDCMPDN